jgi:Fe-S-cluster containining protein
MSTFPCDNCGACCKFIGLSDKTSWLDRGDGVCRHFDEINNHCSIYENRPEICNVKKMYDTYYKDRFNWSEFVAMNQKVCSELKGS